MTREDSVKHIGVTHAEYSARVAAGKSAPAEMEPDRSDPPGILGRSWRTAATHRASRRRSTRA
jgi:hypothetical protein